MKKSYIYRLAEISVLNDHHLPVADKLEILRELFDQEDLELFREDKEGNNDGKSV